MLTIDNVIEFIYGLSLDECVTLNNAIARNTGLAETHNMFQYDKDNTFDTMCILDNLKSANLTGTDVYEFFKAVQDGDTCIIGEPSRLIIIPWSAISIKERIAADFLTGTYTVHDFESSGVYDERDVFRYNTGANKLAQDVCYLAKGDDRYKERFIYCVNEMAFRTTDYVDISVKPMSSYPEFIDRLDAADATAIARSMKWFDDKDSFFCSVGNRHIYSLDERHTEYLVNTLVNDLSEYDLKQFCVWVDETITLLKA